MNMTFKVTIPNVDSAHSVIRVRYISNNPDEVVDNNPTATFYQCADVSIVKSSTKTTTTTTTSSSSSSSPPSSSNPTGCCSPSQWESYAYESDRVGHVNHHIHYDAIKKFVRWDRVGYLESPDVNQTFQLYTNYTTEPFRMEWLYDPATKECILFGADEFNEWCFGESSNQYYQQIVTLSGVNSILWGEMGNDFSWTSDVKNCLPTSTVYDADLIVFYNTTIGIADPSVFEIPSPCSIIPASQMLPLSKRKQLTGLGPFLSRHKSSKL